MRTNQELDQLERSALSWVGTPFVENSSVKGAGVCCHRLVAEILFESGWLPRLDIPGGPSGWARSQDKSLLVDWFEGDGAEYFEQVPTAEAGDVLGFRVGRCVHHLALLLPHGRAIHALDGCGAVILDQLPSNLERRLHRIWRPKHHVQVA